MPVPWIRHGEKNRHCMCDRSMIFVEALLDMEVSRFDLLMMLKGLRILLRIVVRIPSRGCIKHHKTLEKRQQFSNTTNLHKFERLLKEIHHFATVPIIFRGIQPKRNTVYIINFSYGFIEVLRLRRWKKVLN